MRDGPTSTPASVRSSSKSRSCRCAGAFWDSCCCGIVQLTSGRVPARCGSSPSGSVAQRTSDRGPAGVAPSAVTWASRWAIQSPSWWTVVGGELVAAGPAVRDGGAPGLGQQVVPGAVEELAGDDVVAVALGDEDRQVGQPPGVGREARLEGQGPVEDRGPGEPGGVVEHQAAGEGRAAAEARPAAPGRPAGATSSSQLRNQSIVLRSDSATGRPMPRLANQA